MIKLLYLNLTLLILLLATTFVAAKANALGDAKFSLSPASTSKSVGSVFSVDILLDTAAETIDSAAAYLSFPTDLLEATISTDKSFATIFTQKEVDAVNKLIKINGGVSSGKSGSSLNLATINFKVKKAGTAVVSFTDKSVVYKGSSNILSTYTGGTYTLTGSSSAASSATSTRSAAVPAAATSSSESTESTTSLPKSGFWELSLTIIILSLLTLGSGFFLRKTSAI